MGTRQVNITSIGGRELELAGNPADSRQSTRVKGPGGRCAPFANSDRQGKGIQPQGALAPRSVPAPGSRSFDMRSWRAAVWGSWRGWKSAAQSLEVHCIPGHANPPMESKRVAVAPPPSCYAERVAARWVQVRTWATGRQCAYRPHIAAKVILPHVVGPPMLSFLFPFCRPPRF